MTTGTILDRLAAPVQFAVKTCIDQNTIAEWMMTVMKACREYTETVEKRIIFEGRGGIRMTPRGTTSAQYRAIVAADEAASNDGGAASSASKPASRFITISREAKGLQVSMLSTVYTEIVLSIAYLHHRAFELDDLIIFSTRLAEKISRKVAADKVQLPMDSVLDRRQRLAAETAAETAVAERAAERAHMLRSEPYVRDLQRSIRLWYQAFRLYVERHLSVASSLEQHVEDMQSLVSSKSMERLQGRLEDIRRCFIPLLRTYGRSSPIILDQAEDVVLLKQDDFRYPFDASWFGLMVIRSRLGYGRQRLDLMAREMADAGICNPLAQTHSMIRERIERDVRECLLPALVSDQRLQSQVVIQTHFISSIATVLADYIIDFAILCFNFAIGFTDRTSCTTIQLRAVMTIFLQMQSTSLVPLTPRQTAFLADLMTHTIAYTASK